MNNKTISRTVHWATEEAIIPFGYTKLPADYFESFPKDQPITWVKGDIVVPKFTPQYDIRGNLSTILTKEPLTIRRVHKEDGYSAELEFIGHSGMFEWGCFRKVEKKASQAVNS